MPRQFGRDERPQARLDGGEHEGAALDEGDVDAAMRQGVGVGVGVDAEGRRHHITKADDEVLLAVTASSAVSLHKGLRHFEARVRQRAAETQQERAQG